MRVYNRTTVYVISFRALQDRLHPHIGGETLLRMCGNLLPLLDRVAPSGVRGLHSILGAGSNSALRTEPG